MTAFLEEVHGPLGGGSGALSLDADNTFVERYIGRFDRVADPAASYQLVQHGDTPHMGQVSEFRGRWYVVNDIKLKPASDRATDIWNMDVSWTSRIGQNPELAVQNTGHPLLKPMQIAVGTWIDTEYPRKDIEGRPVVTTAGEYLVHPVKRFRRVFRLTKNVPFIPDPCLDPEIEDLAFINSDSFRIGRFRYRKDTLMASEFNVVGPLWENNTLFYTLNFAVYHNPNEWIDRIRNAGWSKASTITVNRPPNEDGEGGGPQDIRILQRITIGPDQQYPAMPVPLTPDGVPYTDPVHNIPIAAGNDNAVGMTDEQWEEAVVERRFRERISFTRHLPSN